MRTFNIRPATADDAHAIATVHVQAYRTAYAAILPQRYLDSFTVERRTAVWTQLIASSSDSTEQIIVGEDGRHIRAFAGYGRSRDPDAPANTGELRALYVAPDHWRYGLGQQLLAESIRWFRGMGFDSATLWVLAANAPARKFYERFGWRADGAQKGNERIEARYRIDLRGPSTGRAPSG